MAKLKALVAKIDGKSSESYKNVLAMDMEYIEGAEQDAFIEGGSGKGHVNKTFLSPGSSTEMSYKQTVEFNSWSGPKRQLFILRHELEYMSRHNLMLQDSSKGINGITTLPRHSLTFENDATDKAFGWMEGI